MSKRSPYGSKKIKIILAALELYEFTTQQLINYAGVEAADFDNAKRSGAPLELGKVIVECGEIRSSRGRSQKVYTFSNPEEHRKLREWVKINFRHDEGSYTVDAVEKRTIDDDKEEVITEDDFLQVRETQMMEKKIEQILLFIIQQSKPDDQSIWASRGLRYLAEWAKKNGVVEPLTQVSNITTEYVKYEVFRLRFFYFLTFSKDESKEEELEKFLEDLLTTCILLEGKEYLAKYFGLVDIGLQMIDELYNHYDYEIQLKKSWEALSSSWEKGEWEERAKWFERCFRDQKQNRLIQQIYTYWLGLYQRIIAKIEYERLSMFPSIREEMLSHRQSDALIELLKEVDRE